jgi:hypothetical protein
MRLAAIECNDAALVAVDEGGVLLAEPAYAVASAAADARPRFGTEAAGELRRLPHLASQRHWLELDDAELPRALGPLRSNADVAAGHLRRLRGAIGPVDGVLLVTPAWWDARQLALLLRLCREAGLPPVGMVDAAVAAARRAFPGRQLLHLEVSLHGLTVSRLRQDDGGTLDGRTEYPGLGIEPLLRTTAAFIAQRFIDTSRYDPLHDAAAVQSLYDALPDWLQRISRNHETTLALDTAAGRCETKLVTADLAARLASHCEPLLQSLRATAGAAALQAHSRLAEFPGIIDALLRVAGVEVQLLAPGAAAIGALARATAIQGALSRPVVTLPWDEAPAPPAASSAVQPARPAPTHLLHGATLYRLDTLPFHVGIDLNPGERGVRLDERVRGVSRKHCTIQRENGALLIFDHSRYGTFLNGHRVEGSAVLEAGDVVTVGNPGAEFRLVAET